MMHVCRRWQRARRVQCTTRVGGASWRNRSRQSSTNRPRTRPPRCTTREHMLAMVTIDQEREDVSTTASDEDVRWLMVEGVQEDVEQEEDEDRSSGDARLERCAQHRRGKDHDHHRFRGRSVGHARGRAPESAEERRTRGQVSPSGQRIKDTRRSRQEDHVRGEERVHAVENVTKALASLTDGEVSADKRGRSGSMQNEQPGPVELHKKK